MDAVGIIEQFGIPIEVKNIEEMTNAVIVDPEYAIVELRCRIWIVLQSLSHVGGPVFLIQFWEIAPPTKMRPRIFQLQ